LPPLPGLGSVGARPDEGSGRKARRMLLGENVGRWKVLASSVD
jgi:hypothetical protein